MLSANTIVAFTNATFNSFSRSEVAKMWLST